MRMNDEDWAAVLRIGCAKLREARPRRGRYMNAERVAVARIINAYVLARRNAELNGRLVP